MDTSYDEEGEAAQDIIEEQDEKLRRAAEIGQSLALRAAELERANELLTEQRDQAVSSLDDHQYRMKELQSESATLHQLVLQKEEAVSRLAAELEESRDSGPEGTGGAAAVDSADAGEQSPAQTQRRARAEELTRLREDTRALQDKEATLQSKIAEEATERRKAERKHKAISDQLASLQVELTEQAASTQAALREREDLIAEAAAERERVSELTIRLAAMESQVQRLEGLGPAEIPTPTPGQSKRQQLSSGAADGAITGEVSPIATGAMDLQADKQEALSSVLAWLKIHSATVSLEPDVDLVAVATAIYERLDLKKRPEPKVKNLVSQAKLHCMMARRKTVSAEDFQQALARLFL